MIEDGVVDPKVMYSRDAFFKVTGMGIAALRHARQRGLIVRRNGTRSWILGSDFIDYLKENSRVLPAFPIRGANSGNAVQKTGTMCG